jgi:superoxide dismutase, Cu-Zn family
VRFFQLGIGAMIAAALLVGVVSAGSEERQLGTAVMRDVTGAEVGIVTLTQQADRMTVHAVMSGLPEGFHGFHIHSVGACSENFTSAGGHLNPGGSHTHAGHVGDMPSLLVNPDGTAELFFVTHHLKMVDLFDSDGSAIIVHADPDNYGNIPTRYAPEPDATTLGTGDAGARIACGIVS